ncbi:imidazolonepropionase [Desulfosporosinus orientis DSM 765]|uniref:Imidazolonepropionase n=1 Tax=Desulfosporosinus orientis (strain ATCC 19365 / DSM 765 / NCIMB 8382 / VKM B-1628 / Singapore I) TaxID=768706 RepID=G7WJK5_DESOD|nr:imidazolonepropionase [Desulfosporosinus orientis]AET70442.1 imidazolonepropionase [Desulfosporosinus orientis DSM 765]
MHYADLLIHSARMMATLKGHSDSPAVGEKMSEIGLIENGAVAIREGKIIAVGTTEEVRKACLGPETKEISAEGKVVTPGFVDPHTHVLYGGSRENELSLKLKGVPYLDILKQGGGILSTVRSTKQASDEEIKTQTNRRLRTMLSFGTTTAEVKSGYGLTVEEELRALRLIHELDKEQAVDLVPTFMGAHAVPAGYSEEEFTDYVIDEMLPKAAAEGLAEFCDVFCEPGVFSLESSERILVKAQQLNLKLKMHADELESAGGAELAAKLGVVSADHLLKVSEAGIAALAQKGVIAALLPATSFNLAKNSYAPAREMVRAGVPIALATDSNPGSSPTESMPLVLTIACLYLRLTPEEALAGATINAAHAIGRADQVGSLEVGKKGDVLILDIPNLNYLPYHFGNNPVEKVIKGGKLVWEAQA